MDPAFEAVLRRRLRNLPAETPLDPTAPLTDLGLDSMEAVELVFDIEDELGVALPDDTLTGDTFATARSLGAVVDRVRSEPTSSPS
ncbi:acyl carrier protein [Micromonospora echinofusca]|uniref:Acyl carrier protein n=1 Tax=Micromonospora echinofusca TaxID=47858 RepID=A0ABS3VJC8_MICEH|nr:acyl carrier protein [Micromonospora echinofusca]